MKSISGKSIIVTGGANGIGQATALLLAENGALVTVADINAVDGEATVKEIKSRGGNAQFIKTDISKADEVQAMVGAAVDAHGKLDGAFNNAAIPNLGRRIHEITIDEWNRCQSINVTGTFLCIKYEIEQMLKAGGGSIVNTASVAGLVYVPLTGEYSVSKHGVVGLTKAAAADYGRDNIRVNAVAPGAVRTAMFAKSCEDNPDLEEYCKSVHPIGRFGQPIELAEAAMWLLSDSASFVTGAILPVDGGYTAV